MLLYPCFKKNESRKIASLLKKSPDSFTWNKEYLQTKPFWVADYASNQLPKPIKVRITPCVTYGLFWNECTKSSIPTLVLGIPMRIVDWKTHYSIPLEEYFIDVTKLDELVIDTLN